MRARIRVVPVCGWRRRAKFAAEARKTLHVPWVPEDSRGLRRVACQRCWRLLAPACVLLLSSLSGSAVWRVGGRFRLCKFSLVCSRLCAAVAQILGGAGGALPHFFCGVGFTQMPSRFRYLAYDGSRGGERGRLAIMGVCYIPFFPRLCSFRRSSFHWRSFRWRPALLPLIPPV